MRKFRTNNNIRINREDYEEYLDYLEEGDDNPEVDAQIDEDGNIYVKTAEGKDVTLERGEYGYYVKGFPRGLHFPGRTKICDFKYVYENTSVCLLPTVFEDKELDFGTDPELLIIAYNTEFSPNVNKRILGEFLDAYKMYSINTPYGFLDYHMDSLLECFNGDEELISFIDEYYGDDYYSELDILKEKIRYHELSRKTGLTIEELEGGKGQQAAIQDFEARYKKLISQLEGSLEQGKLDINEYIKLMAESGLTNYNIFMEKDEDGNYELRGYRKNSITEGTIIVSQDGSRLAEIIEEVNSKIKKEKKKELDEIVQKGKGEIIIDGNNSWRRVENLSKTSRAKGVLGTLSEGGYAPVLVGGNPKDGGFAPLEVVIPYRRISLETLGYTEVVEERMSEEQISKFNHMEVNVKPINIGYRRIYTLKIGGKTYELSRGSHGDLYSVDICEDGPTMDNGISICAYNITSVANMIKQSPRRFAEYYKDNNERQDCCGTFPLSYIQDVNKGMVKLPTESQLELLAMQEEQENQGDNEFVDTLLGLAAEKTDGKKSLEQAVELAEEYDKLDPDSKEQSQD